MTNYDMANERISDDLSNNKIDTTTDNINANNYAKNIMNSYEQDLNNPQHSQQYPQHEQHERNMRNEEPVMSSAQYQPPVPPSQQPPVPQQSQHMNVNQQSSSQPMMGSYTGFDTSENLSPIDASFNTIKEPVRQRANINSSMRTNETVEPYSDVETEMFASY
jgi:hypothetical protein